MAVQRIKGIARVSPVFRFWGLIDTNGNYVLEPICNDIHDWNDDIARLVRVSADKDNDGKYHSNMEYGYINTEGKIIRDFSPGYSLDFSLGLAGVSKEKKWGFIDTNGQLVIPYQFDEVHYSSFIEEGCIVCLDKKWGLIDRNGKWILDNTFERLDKFAFGLSVATIESEFSFGEKHSFIIDIHGNKIVDLPKEWAWFKPVSEKLILVGTSSGFPGGRTFGFMDLQGRIKSEPQFYTNSDSGFYTGDFIDGKLFVSTKDGKKGYVNEDGEFQPSDLTRSDFIKKEVQNRPFDEVAEFSEGLAVARKGDYWGVIDEDNKVVIDFIYKWSHVNQVGDKGLFFSHTFSFYPKFSCGLIGIREAAEKSRCGYIDREGKIAIEPKFITACSFYPIKKQ